MAQAKQEAATGANLIPSTAKAGPKKGGRPVTWIGGGGLNQAFVANKGVPELRALFLEVFGHPTASNNSTWLRRKLSEPPDETYGRGRSAKIRRRDLGAAIWTTGTVSSFTQAEVSILKKTGGNLPADRVIVVPNNDNPTPTTPTPTRGKRAHPGANSPNKVTSGPSAWQVAYSGKEHKAAGQPTSPSTPTTPTKKATRTRGSLVYAPAVLDESVERKIRELKALEEVSGFPSPAATIEVFWPDDGGSWWPARVLKVMTRKGVCRVLYDTQECEELNLREILPAGHLRVKEGVTAKPATSGNVSDDSSQDTLLPQPSSASSTPLPKRSKRLSSKERRTSEDGLQPTTPPSGPSKQAFLGGEPDPEEAEPLVARSTGMLDAFMADQALVSPVPEEDKEDDVADAFWAQPAPSEDGNASTDALEAVGSSGTLGVVVKEEPAESLMDEADLMLVSSVPVNENAALTLEAGTSLQDGASDKDVPLATEVSMDSSQGIEFEEEDFTAGLSSLMEAEANSDVQELMARDLCCDDF